MAKKHFLQDAILEGKHMDCVFLVGPDDGEQEEVRGVKALLMMASHYMETLFSGRWSKENSSEPIRLNNVRPKIFKLVVEYINFSQLLNPIGLLDAVDLAQAANYFGIESLKKLCKTEIQNSCTVNEFWSTLSCLLKNGLRSIAYRALSQLLSENTYACLSHPDFLVASEDSMDFVLDMEKMDLFCESRLICFCRIWADKQEDHRKSLRNLLPKLRVLTIDFDELLILRYLFQDEEWSIIEKYHLYKELPDQDLPAKICAITEPRQLVCKFVENQICQEFTQKLIPDSLVDRNLDKYVQCSERYRFIVRLAMQRTSVGVPCQGCGALQSVSNTLNIVSKVDMYLTSIHMICRVQGNPMKIIPDGGLQNSYKVIAKVPNYNCHLLLHHCSKRREIFSVCNYSQSLKVDPEEPIFIAKDRVCEFFIIECIGPCTGELYWRHFTSQMVSEHISRLIDKRIFKEITVDANAPSVFISGFSYVVGSEQKHCGTLT